MTMTMSLDDGDDNVSRYDNASRFLPLFSRSFVPGLLETVVLFLISDASKRRIESGHVSADGSFKT